MGSVKDAGEGTGLWAFPQGRDPVNLKARAAMVLLAQILP